MLDSNEKLKRIEALNRKIRACRKCRLYETRTHALPGEGNISAKLIMIAQAPGYTEDKEGRMFIGPSGKKLDELLKDACIVRDEIFMTNILRCMLPNYRKPRSDEIKTCTPYLDKEIGLINPNIISSLGYFASRYIFEKYNFEDELEFPDVCGKVFVSNDKKIVPLRHPAALLYNDSIQDEMIEEYRVLKRLLD